MVVVTIVLLLRVAGVWTVARSDVAMPQCIRMVVMVLVLHIGIKVVRGAAAKI